MHSRSDPIMRHHMQDIKSFQCKSNNMSTEIWDADSVTAILFSGGINFLE